MAYHDDLLEQAEHLAYREIDNPRQASLRRAISSAYYALFHLLVSESVSQWGIPDQRPQLARIFEHTRMNSASTRVLNERLLPFAGQNPAIVTHLKTIAITFTELYEERQTADYDTATQWSRIQVLALIDSVKEAFKSLNAIRNESIVNDYLLSLFVKDRQQR